MKLDCRGQRCPQPVIELARAAKSAETGIQITIVTDDPAAAVDIPAWSRMRGHHCVLLSDVDGVLEHTITLMRTA